MCWKQSVFCKKTTNLFIQCFFFANDGIKLNLNMVKLLRNTSLAPKGALTHSLQSGKTEIAHRLQNPHPHPKHDPCPKPVHCNFFLQNECPNSLPLEFQRGFGIPRWHEPLEFQYPLGNLSRSRIPRWSWKSNGVLVFQYPMGYPMGVPYLPSEKRWLGDCTPLRYYLTRSWLALRWVWSRW